MSLMIYLGPGGEGAPPVMGLCIINRMFQVHTPYITLTGSRSFSDFLKRLSEILKLKREIFDNAGIMKIIHTPENKGFQRVPERC